MDEEKITRDKSGSRKREDTGETAGKKTFGKKLKNETSRAEAMRSKLRFEKADTKETVLEIKKKARMRAQGRKKSYSDLAVSAKIHASASHPRRSSRCGQSVGMSR